MTPALVSVMMPAYNAQAYIGAAIESVQKQTYPHWELVVINDGSTDQTRSILETLDDPRIRIVHQENAGEAAARNHALELIQGEYLAFLDSDDQYMPEFLEQMVQVLQENPTLDGVYTDGIYIDQDGQEMNTLSSTRRGPFTGNLCEALVRASDVFGPPICVIIRRSALLEMHSQFDTRIVIGPDWDFFIHFCETTQFTYLDRVLCRYRVHQSNITLTTGSAKRRESLAICREKAIQLASFPRFSLATREYVFYDLLVNLLTGQPGRQNQITTWAQFQELPPAVQSRLFRLMASQSLRDTINNAPIQSWLDRAVQCNPSDPKSRMLAAAYRVFPTACRTFLIFRSKNAQQPKSTSPFKI